MTEQEARDRILAIWADCKKNYGRRIVTAVLIELLVLAGSFVVLMLASAHQVSDALRSGILRGLLPINAFNVFFFLKAFSKSLSRYLNYRNALHLAQLPEPIDRNGNVICFADLFEKNQEEFLRYEQKMLP